MPTLRFIRAFRPSDRLGAVSRLIFTSAFLLLPPFLILGCSRFHPVKHEFVYVSARQVYLHDRVAAVSNRVGLVTNGETLEVVEQGKRFVKVRTPKGEVGWLEDHAVIDDKLYAQFEDLAKKHAQDPVVANGELRDDLYLHVLPGRETPHFLLIPGNSKVQLLERGTVPKAPAPGTIPVEKTVKPKVALSGSPVKSGEVVSATENSKSTPASPSKPEDATPPAVPPAAGPPSAPVPMEDWWLIRDNAGHTGWILANRLDVDVPDEVGEYAEGQRMVAAYPIAKVTDDGTGREHKGSDKSSNKSRKSRGAKAPEPASETGSDVSAEDAASAPVSKEITEYVTVLSPPRGGLPYDFDQIRIFTWSLNHHRYETAYRLHGIQGYLPVKISKELVNGVEEPVFSFEIANGPDVSVDPETGVTHPVSSRTLAFRLEGNIVKRTGADQSPIILTHDPEESEKAKAAGKKKKKK